MTSPEGIPILLVEDDENDILMTKRAFTRYHITNQLYVVRDGEEALDFIYRRGDYADESLSTPGLILLDLTLPKMGGIEVLRHLKGDPEKRNIPVVILTASRREKDKIESYNLGVNSYIVKPVEFNKFIEAISTINLYWSLNQLPD
ncbi:two-component system response regulator [candidate division TA06 bacterium B3_TA06]|uniref:Two-component system response regulator n=1 Tax=candidate division TA06 bacterium B3_TA06 TaxID=2012487 RepID=A0A532V8K1_UNCT6|nr:MAG: two-component system response regulator [candidate division TA06 bacterium B3_TA06]